MGSLKTGRRNDDIDLHDTMSTTSWMHETAMTSEEGTIVTPEAPAVIGLAVLRLIPSIEAAVRKTRTAYIAHIGTAAASIDVDTTPVLARLLVRWAMMITTTIRKVLLVARIVGIGTNIVIDHEIVTATVTATVTVTVIVTGIVTVGTGKTGNTTVTTMMTNIGRRIGIDADVTIVVMKKMSGNLKTIGIAPHVAAAKIATAIVTTTRTHPPLRVPSRLP